jgi:phage terminase large subunit
MFKYTTAIRKLRKLTKRVKIIRGGTSAGKTFGIIPILIDYAARHSNTEISIVSESIPHLRRGAIKDFLKIMQWTGRFNPEHWNKSLLTYYFTNRSYIEFFSADQEQKLRGARRNILYINECNNVNFESYHQLAIRTNGDIWLDYNPVNSFWVDTELIGDEDSELVVLTYKDNEALDQSIVKEIEKAREKAETSDYWANWWKVYGLGEVGMVQGTIFTNWQQIDNVPSDATLKGIGIDFGYSNDPTAIISTYYHNGTYIFHEVEYKTEMLNSDVAQSVKPLNTHCICDSAEPKSIAELKRLGVRAMPCDKGKDSVNFGIQSIQQMDKFYITSSSTNLIKEVRGYVWMEGKTKPIEHNNHAIDAMRYIYTHLTNKRSGHYDIR